MEQNKENKERYGIIYKIENTVNGKVYIGQTTSSFNKRYKREGVGIERVYNHHKSLKERNIHYNVHLLGAIEKYGFEAFTVDEEFDVAYSKEQLDSLEKKYIKEFNCVDNGYNNTDGGSNGKHSEESRKKMSESRKGKYCGENSPNYGKPMSEEQKRKISEARKGKRCGENHPRYGKHYTEEEKIQMSEKAKERWNDPEDRRKMSEIRKVKYCGEENPNFGNHKLAGRNNPRARKVICLNENKVFNTGKECAEYYKINVNNLVRICKGEQKSTRTGLVFAYYDEYLQQQEQQDQAAI